MQLTCMFEKRFPGRIPVQTDSHVGILCKGYVPIGPYLNSLKFILDVRLCVLWTVPRFFNICFEDLT